MNNTFSDNGNISCAKIMCEENDLRMPWRLMQALLLGKLKTHIAWLGDLCYDCRNMPTTNNAYSQSSFISGEQGLVYLE